MSNWYPESPKWMSVIGRFFFWTGALFCEISMVVFMVWVFNHVRIV